MWWSLLLAGKDLPDHQAYTDAKTEMIEASSPQQREIDR
jgi:hypothetical protein